MPSSGCKKSRSEEHTSELQSHDNLVCRLLLEKKKITHAILHTLRAATHLAIQLLHGVRAEDTVPRAVRRPSGGCRLPEQFFFFFFNTAAPASFPLPPPPALLRS